MKQITIRGKKTYDDLGLLLAPDSSIGEAKVKTYLVDIPHGNGTLDLSEAITGEVSFEDREISFKLLLTADVSTWNPKARQLKNLFHGKRCEIIMPQYEGYYFIGRVSVGAIEQDNSVAYVPFKAIVEPFALKMNKTIASHSVPSSGVLNLVLNNERMTTMPTFTTSANVKITFGGKSHLYTAGTFQSTGILLREGDNPIKIEAVAGTTINITYQEGAL
ncbi:hypothetical protein M2904_06350 [Vagococcus lutrae]|uniref:hypothetical protein n=1 Tax=Vagococcus lutrae TaxID=81947 RepID=UPI00200D72CF|nr:hypothetical protein [Vagococcus lutrae]UQF11364.1 hypothetical protein M2919_07670 [Vagococcus lutrae]UQF37745.1 hypothetical protein M2904_06350 [Vagococcus lutrae]